MLQAIPKEKPPRKRKREEDASAFERQWMEFARDVRRGRARMKHERAREYRLFGRPQCQTMRKKRRRTCGSGSWTVCTVDICRIESHHMPVLGMTTEVLFSVHQAQVTSMQCECDPVPVSRACLLPANRISTHGASEPRSMVT